jgi:hypothetical protein
MIGKEITFKFPYKMREDFKQSYKRCWTESALPVEYGYTRLQTNEPLYVKPEYNADGEKVLKVVGRDWLPLGEFALEYEGDVPELRFYSQLYLGAENKDYFKAMCIANAPVGMTPNMVLFPRDVDASELEQATRTEGACFVVTERDLLAAIKSAYATIGMLFK